MFLWRSSQSCGCPRQGTSGGHLVQTLLQQCHPGLAVQHHVHTAAGHSKDGASTTSPSAAPVLGHTHNEKVFPEVQRDPPVFQCVPVASGPGTGHHWEEPGSLQSLIYLHVPSLASPHYLPSTGHKARGVTHHGSAQGKHLLSFTSWKCFD